MVIRTLPKLYLPMLVTLQHMLYHLSGPFSSCQQMLLPCLLFLIMVTGLRLCRLQLLLTFWEGQPELYYSYQRYFFFNLTLTQLQSYNLQLLTIPATICTLSKISCTTICDNSKSPPADKNCHKATISGAFTLSISLQFLKQKKKTTTSNNRITLKKSFDPPSLSYACFNKCPLFLLLLGKAHQLTLRLFHGFWVPHLSRGDGTQLLTSLKTA